MSNLKSKIKVFNTHIYYISLHCISPGENVIFLTFFGVMDQTFAYSQS